MFLRSFSSLKLLINFINFLAINDMKSSKKMKNFSNVINNLTKKNKVEGDTMEGGKGEKKLQCRNISPGIFLPGPINLKQSNLQVLLFAYNLYLSNSILYLFQNHPLLLFFFFVPFSHPLNFNCVSKACFFKQ